MIAALALTAALVVAPTASSADCTAESGAFTWGFKESFRAYISGSIANGGWTTDGDLGYETPAFFSEALAGSLALDPIEGELGVEGSLRFTGHDGILDTTISNLRFVVESPERLTVVVDLRGTTQDFVPVDSVDVPFLSGDLAAAQWSETGDALLLEGIPLTLTAEGAEAFGTYPAGEAFDPLDLEVSTSAECAARAIEAHESDGSLPLAVGATVLATALGGALTAVLVARARRRSASAEGPSSGV